MEQNKTNLRHKKCKRGHSLLHPKIEGKGKRRCAVCRRMRNIYDNMLSRCNNPKDKHYKNYGGRGITICPEWVKSFDNFYNDMYPLHDKKKTLDRIDNDKGYFKENCKFSTWKQQHRNKRELTGVPLGRVPYRGVFFTNGKYRAKLYHKNKQICLGAYDTPEEAYEVYKKARKKYGRPPIEDSSQQT